MSVPDSTNPPPLDERKLADRDHHGWLAWLPWWIPAWVPLVAIGGLLVFAAGAGLVVADLSYR